MELRNIKLHVWVLFNVFLLVCTALSPIAKSYAVAFMTVVLRRPLIHAQPTHAQTQMSN